MILYVTYLMKYIIVSYRAELKNYFTHILDRKYSSQEIHDIVVVMHPSPTVIIYHL